MRRGVADAPEDFDAVQPGHPDVEEDQVGAVAAERGERRLAVGRGLDAEPLALEILAEHVADRLLVVDDQNVPQVVGVAAHAGKYLIRRDPGSRHSAGLAGR